MTIELLTDSYSNAAGINLRGTGQHEVTDEVGRYLLSTFPEWFSRTDADEAEPIEDSAPFEGIDTPDEPGTGVADQTDDADEAEDNKEPSEPEAPSKPLSKLNKTELIDLAVSMDLDLSGEVTVDELRAAIKAHQETNAV